MEKGDISTNQLLKVEIVRFKIGGWERINKRLLFVFACMLILAYSTYRYLWPHDRLVIFSTINMRLPDKNMEVIFKYPDKLCFEDVRETTIKIKKIDGKVKINNEDDIYPITCILLPKDESRHTVGFIEDGYFSEITLKEPQLEYNPKIRISEGEGRQEKKCEFQLGVKAKNMSEMQYSEFHSIEISPKISPKISLQPAIAGIIISAIGSILAYFVIPKLEKISSYLHSRARLSRMI